MNVTQLAAGVVLLFTLVSPSFAATPAQGVINFKGRIFGPSCEASAGAGGVVEVSRCPLTSRANIISVRNMLPIADAKSLSGAPAEVKRVRDSGKNKTDYDQKYVLVDRAGRRIESGTYLITLTAQ